MGWLPGRVSGPFVIWVGACPEGWAVDCVSWVCSRKAGLSGDWWKHAVVLLLPACGRWGRGGALRVWGGMLFWGVRPGCLTCQGLGAVGGCGGLVVNCIVDASI